jgi:hypothetical protein
MNIGPFLVHEETGWKPVVLKKTGRRVDRRHFGGE